ncbi:MAG: glycosyltransferase family 2 protein, partial [Thermoproteota archaeon]
IVRSYKLPLPLECWVVIEEGDDPRKYSADRVIVVPKSFKCLAHAKARALEYARRERIRLADEGKISKYYFVVQGDDDSIVSRELLMDALTVESDIVVGTICPRKTSLLGTLLDFERPYTCMHTCMFFTNLGHVIYGHGESQMHYWYVERIIDYEFKPLNGKRVDDVPVMGNEDMYFLHKAEMAGLKVYKSEKPVYISPPLTFGDAVKQRRRWIWGNFNIVYIKRMMPLSHAVRFMFVHACAFMFYPLSQVGLILSLLGILKLNFIEAVVGFASVTSWYAIRFYSIGKVMGWKNGLIGALVTKVTTFLNFTVLMIGVLQGDPKRFDVIKKTV